MPNDLDDPMTNLQLLAIVAIVTNNVRDKSLIDPADHFGIADEVKRAQSDESKQLLQDVLRKECGINWDGKTWLWDFFVTEAREQAKINLGYAEWGVDQRRRDDARRMLTYWETMKCGVALGILENARSLLLSDPIPKPIDPGEIVIDTVEEIADVL